MKYCLFCFILLIAFSNNYASGIVDQVQIGEQIWMTRNLDVEVYRNGDTIPQITDPEEWINADEGAWCYYENEEEHGKNFGKLYNWYAVNDPRGLAPEGWRVASDDDWKELEIFLGLSEDDVDDWAYRGLNEGGKLKDTKSAYWNLPNIGATNEYNFDALPAGYRSDQTGEFKSLYNGCAWWTSSSYTFTGVIGRGLHMNEAGISRFNFGKYAGFSVRCIKD
jgi:uncharacterized protein (TIGR02145 family)